MEIRFEIPQMIKAVNPKPIIMEVKTREVLEAKQGLTDLNKISQLPFDTFYKQEKIEDGGLKRWYKKRVWTNKPYVKR